MQKKVLEHKSFDIAQTQNKVLSIRVSPDGLYFVVTDEGKDNLVLHTSRIIDPARGGLDILVEEMKNGDLLGRPFLKTNVFYETEQYTLVPKFELEKTRAEEIAKTCFGEEKMKGMVVMCDEVSFTNSSVVYTVLDSDLERIKSYFPDARIFHHVHAPLYGAMTTAKTKDSYALININSFFFDIIVVENGAIRLCGGYRYKSTEEFLYYVLGITSTLHIDPYALKVLVVGEVDEYSSIVKNLNKYLMTYYPDSIKGVTLKKPFSKVDNFQYYFTLFLSSVCV